MGYKRAEDILPSEMISRIQDYVDGEYLYIPRKEENRRAWGDGTNTRRELQERDAEIFRAYEAGAARQELAEKFFLSEKSIGRIINKEKQGRHRK